MQEYTQLGGVRPFGCCLFQNLERRYKDGLSIDDGLGIIISTLREGYDRNYWKKYWDCYYINLIKLMFFYIE